MRRWAAPALLLLLLIVTAACGQDAVTVKLDKSGMMTLLRGGTQFGMMEFNAHGPEWKHAPQQTATATVSDLPGGGKRIVGTLPIPNTTGALMFTQTVKPSARGLQLEYDIAAAGALKLNGLQWSLLLPIPVFAGKDMIATRLEGEPDIMGFPQDTPFQGWGGQAARIEVARGTPDAIAVELRAATDVAVQDLSKWERQEYEVRFPAISEDGGRDVTPDDRFHLELTVTLGGPVTLASQ